MSNDTSFRLACFTKIVWQVGQIFGSSKNVTKTATTATASAKGFGGRKWSLQGLIEECNSKSIQLVVPLCVLSVLSGGFHEGEGWVVIVAASICCSTMVVAAVMDMYNDFKYDESV